MPAWQILERIRRRFELDTVVGPSALEVPPTFSTWLTPSTGYALEPQQNPLILLDAIPLELREE
eukprot:2043173-Rhodomonas_salina.1